MDTDLAILTRLPIRAENGGLFISQGRGIHARRVIDSHELIFVERGVLSMEEDGVGFDVEAGQTLLLFPGRVHAGVKPFPPDLRFYWIHFDLLESGESADEVMRVPQHAALSDPDRLTALYRRFLDDQEFDRLSPVSAGLIIMQMLCEVALSQHWRENGAGASAVLAQRADYYIRQHFERQIGTSSIARALDCDPDYLGRVYSSVCGVTITKAIHLRRMRKAKALLIDGELPVERIAARCGFEDVGYFRRLFRRYEGVAPLAYRRLHARMHVTVD